MIEGTAATMNEPIFPVDSQHPGMKRAVSTARKSFRFFWREMTWEYRRIIPGLDLAAIKAAFTDHDDLASADDVEQMWVNDVEFDGRTLRGTLINQPNELISVSQGDAVEISLREITDWMYASQGKVYGGFTVNHIRSEMSKAERKAHDAAWGLDFGDPAVTRFVPPEYIGRKPPGFLARLLGRGEESQDAAEVAATEHPMAINMLDSMKDAFRDRDNLVAADDNGLNVLHSMSLGGAARGVNVLIRLGADPTVETHHGDTAWRLAKRVGWKNVLKVLEKHGVTK